MAKHLRVLCFHPALAPYRVDFFNHLSTRVEFKLVLMLKDLRTQGFDQEKLKALLRIPVEYARTIVVKGRDIPIGCIHQATSFAPDIVLTYECSPVTLIMIFLRRIFGSSASVWSFFDDSPDLIEARKGLRRFVRDWTMRRLTGVIVPSELSISAYKRVVKGAARLKFSVVPIIHDTDVFRHDARKVFFAADKWRRKHLSEGERMVLFVGRLSSVKNLLWLAERTKDKAWPNKTRLFLVGDGELRKALKDKAVLLGRHEGMELQIFFAAADVLVLPSVSEPFGAVVAEALQWGCPVLVSDRVGAKSLVTPENGAIFRFDDEEDFDGKLGSLVARSNQWSGFRESILPVDLGNSVSELIEKMP